MPVIDYLSEEHRKPLKNGKPSKKSWITIFIPYTKINCCEVCGKLGPRNKIYVRNDVYAWNLTKHGWAKTIKEDWTTAKRGMLCMACWNKIRPIVRREDECYETLRLIRKLKRTIDHERKQNDSHNRRTEGLSGDNDGRGEEWGS